MAEIKRSPKKIVFLLLFLAVIAGITWTVWNWTSQSMSECSGDQLSKEFELRVTGESSDGKYIEKVIHGQPTRVRADWVIRNNEIESISETSEDLGRPQIKIKLTEPGKEKFSAATSNINGALIVEIGGLVASAPVVTERITSGELSLSLEKGTDPEGRIIYFKARDFCNQ